MNLTTEQIQAILDGAPEGATHVDCDNAYWELGGGECFKWLTSYSGYHATYCSSVKPVSRLSDLREILTLRQEVERLKAEPPTPNEQGKNRYGLDMAYFRNVINRELNRPLVDFKPDELSRVFARLSKTADKAVMFEPEFSKSHDSEVAARAVEGFASELKERAKLIPLGAESKSKGASTYNWQMFYAEVAENYAKQLREQGDV